MGVSIKLKAGEGFPQIDVTMVEGRNVSLGKPRNRFSWKAIFVYRGKHCPICTSYLNELETFQQELYGIGVDILAVSADTKETLKEHMNNGISVTYPIAYGLTVEQMELLGLYISSNVNDQGTEHHFSEPGLFIVNEQGNVQVADISNVPFARPELKTLIAGLRFIRSKENYPIRGMAGYHA